MHVVRIDAFGDPELPAFAGREPAGVVAEVGPAVTGVSPDARGVALRGPGCCATDVVLVTA